MPNSLTGDFEAVLQISGATINRLLASMHQNAFSNINLPSFPHSVQMRIGDGHSFDGVRGRVHAHLSVPQVELIHGATDRFILEVGVRAWYKPDPATSPLPAFIHGTVRAEYRIQDIDPACIGWAKLAPDNLWFRVVKDSVRFQGTAEEDRAGLASVVSPATEAANLSKITKQIAVLLATRFEATPHPVSKRFRRGSLRTLNAPIGGSAVATSLSLNGDPAGDIASINTILLDGADVAIGITRDYIMSLAQPTLDKIAGFNPTIPVSVHFHTDAPLVPDYDFSTVYRVKVDPPSIQWLPQGSYAIIRIKASGSAKTDSKLPDATFNIEQDIVLNFDGAGEALWLSAGSRNVTVDVSVGVGSDIVHDNVSNAVNNNVKSMVDAACANVQPMLDKMIGRKQELIDQLRSIDLQADAHFNQALFQRDGLILRGFIRLAGRPATVAAFDKTLEQDGLTALESWIPGGRIDTFEWSWGWAGSGDPGKSTHDDRFLLRRPPGTSSRWGTASGLTFPLPGLDGYGFVCLKITGVLVDPVTGRLVPVESARVCTRYGINISDTIQKDKRLLVRDMPELSQEVAFPELALVSLGAGPNAAGRANTLLLYVDEAWDRETASTLKHGLEQCGRYDAGLHLLVLFREGVLAAKGADLMRQVEESARKSGIAVLVNEDVGSGWSRALDLRTGEPSWRLLSPDGGVTWTHQGRLAPERLTAALDNNLVRCPDPAPVAFRSGTEFDKPVTAIGVDPEFFEQESHCPPIPLRRLGVGGAVVAFVQKGSASSNAQLRRLSERYGQDKEGPLVVVVVDGVDKREAEVLKNELGFDFVAVPDPTGAITDQFGVRIWPTTMTLDRVGTISEIETGIAPERDDAVGPTYAAE
ncbi:hypothetical protein BH18ACI4_BH18ACI4_05070 [soil metagenome]